MSESFEHSDTCPNEATHTPRPSGYIAWFEWAERMSKHFKQVRCGGCGLYAIWVPKDPANPAKLVPPQERGCVAINRKHFL